MAPPKKPAKSAKAETADKPTEGHTSQSERAKAQAEVAKAHVVVGTSRNCMAHRASAMRAEFPARRARKAASIRSRSKAAKAILAAAITRCCAGPRAAAAAVGAEAAVVVDRSDR